MNSAAQTLLLLIGTSMGLFVLISLLVLMPGGTPRRIGSGPVWIGGPGRSERGVSTSDPVLTDRVPRWAETSATDWVAAAETAEPGRTGGASAEW
ncbi:hypothetical protein [Nonomuraea maritima]|uniref:hypothetical protein n=1 Tax=Nonomuraea maritima TaxID=683260 RepID=UPI00371618EF